MTRLPDELNTHLYAWFGESAGVAIRSIDGVCPLFPEEEAIVHRAVPRRREEFSTGRWCARQALGQMGLPPPPILMGRWREPIWPPGVVGSISHATNICAAVVVPATSFGGIGIDLLETNASDRLLPDLSRFITGEEEEDCAQAIESADVEPLVLLFSAKESVIKAISGRLQRYVDFTEIQVKFDGNTFEACLNNGDFAITGWWVVMEALVLTGAVLALG